MEWWIVLSGGLGALLLLLLIGMPVFLAFLIINVAGTLLVLGEPGFGLFANSIFETTNTAALATIALFILMGELLFRSGTIEVVFNSVDTLIGRVRGRQYVLCISLSAVLGALSGAAMGVVAMLGRSLYPTMVRRGYDWKLSAGTILGGASLAPIIPPSVLIIVIGSLADVSIAALLVAGLLPGLMLASLFLIYTFARVWMNPALAPEEIADSNRRPGAVEKVVALARMLPFMVIIFCVMGFILLGVATPSESAATGVVGAILTAAYYRKLSFAMLRESLLSAAGISAMILIIMASATMFSQLLAFTGATSNLAKTVVLLGLEPILMLFVMMLMPFVLCMFIDQIALLLVIIPIYKPILVSLGFDPIWFWTLMLLNVTVGGLTPPFGYTMFAFKGVVPDLKLSAIFSASWPFVGLFVLGMVILAIFPALATYLPGLL